MSSTIPLARSGLTIRNSKCTTGGARAGWARTDVAIAKGNGACRSFGFYLAWHEANEDELIVALDDDCAVDPAFVATLPSRFAAGPKPAIAGSGRHWNIFDLYEDPEIRSQFPRGFPYAARSVYHAWHADGAVDGPVMANLGLWRGYLDVGGVDRIGADDAQYPSARLLLDQVVVPPGTLVTMCSGNMQFRRAAIPAIYQWPMAVEVVRGWKINRFGDIWGGFVLKTLMDRRGDRLSVGGPMVHHARVGPAAFNARQEHLAHLVNEEFIALLEQACAEVRPDGYLQMMSHLRAGTARGAPGTSPILRCYLETLDQCLAAWLAALRGVRS